MTSGIYLPGVLDRLADLVAEVKPEQYAAPTVCPEFDVALLRSHTLAWARFFADVFERPEATDRLDVDSYEAPEEPAAAAAVLREAGQKFAKAVEGGVAQRDVAMFGDPMPGWMGLNMCLSEYLVHGNDLSQATGLPWNPEPEAVAAALVFMPSMLTDDFRGPDKSFGYPVEVPGTASDLDKLVAFTGRDPFWKAA